MIFYINPLITTKMPMELTHTHTDTKNQNLIIPRKKEEEEETQRKTAREERGQNNYKQKIVNKMVIVSPSLSITRLNGNGVNSPVKRH